MERNTVRSVVLAVLLVVTAAGVRAADPSAVKKLLASVGIPPSATRRGQMDVVGFASTSAQMDAVVSQCDSLAASRLAELRANGILPEDAVIAAGVCPHDDYYYAGRFYALLLPHIHAKTVIIFGVFHKARAFACRDHLVFDSFDAWRGPYGPVKTSALRDELTARLPKDDVIVDNDMQTVEHSVEAIVPWLQAGNRDVEIVSILVPFMDWHTMDRLAGEVSAALASIMREKGWVPGRDVAIIASADAVHYGDAGWGGSVYADFGTSPDGYAKAVERDRHLADSLLTGSLHRDALREFLYACVDSTDVTRYTLTWCGRFSVPFGLNVASRLKRAMTGRPMTGTLLDYGTSLGEVSLDLTAIPGLGTTAPNHLHHWVGYAAIGYR